MIPIVFGPDVCLTTFFVIYLDRGIVYLFGEG